MGSRATRLARPISKMTESAKPVIQCEQKMSNKFGKLHVKCREEIYPRSNIKRFQVRDEFVPWDVDYKDYQPVVHTSESVLKKPVWADVDLLSDNTDRDIVWNAVTGKVDRTSHMGLYDIGADDLPRNPVGRTGIKGRGCLGRWGPNHAADPIVTRWKRDEEGNRVQGEDGNFIAQFVAVKRRDNGQWALPGGMVDPGEKISVTLKREFGEEALNSLEMSDEEKEKTEKKISELFTTTEDKKPVYSGYVDDPRNTDNSWMETVAMHFHDENGEGFSKITLNAGDDAVGVQWMDLTSKLQIYASHIDFLQKVAVDLGCSW